MSRTVTITHHDKPWTVNSARHASSHWVEQKRTKEWRTAFATLARMAGEEPFTRVTITVDHQTRTNRLPDTCSCVLAAKAGIDGLVDAGLLPDDSPQYVTSVTYLPPHRTGQDGLSITLTEVSGA